MRRCLAITKKHQTQYLELVASGVNPSAAAKQVDPKYTGTMFRSLASNDPTFAEARDAAVEAGRGVVASRARVELIERQLDPNSELKTDRGLHNLMILYDLEYRAAHRQGATVNLNQELEITNVHVAIEGARDRLVHKLAPVLELVAAPTAEAGDRSRTG